MSETNIRHLPDGLVVHDHHIHVPGVSKKIIYHFSDTHLTLFDSLSDEEETARGEKSTAHWLELREGFARHHGQPCTEAQLKSADTHFRNLMALAGEGDAVILCGDIFDYISGANMRFYDAEAEKVRVPVLAVCGNHEISAEIPEDSRFAPAKKAFQTIDLGDMIIVGLDDSLREVTVEQNAALLKVLDMGKPVLVAMHVPVATEENAEILERCGEYFRLNHPEATAATLEFIDILKKNADKIIAVLAGHLHFSNESEIAPGLTQFVSTQGILGNINRYEIGE